MRGLLRKLWRDDVGALIPAEFLFMTTILIFGTVAGLVSVRDAVTTQLTELASSIGSLQHCFSFSGFRSCNSFTCGSATGPDICHPAFLAPTASPVCGIEQFNECWGSDGWGSDGCGGSGAWNVPGWNGGFGGGAGWYGVPGGGRGFRGPAFRGNRAPARGRRVSDEVEKDSSNVVLAD